MSTSRHRRTSPRVELLDGVIGFAGAFALGLTIMIAITIVRGEQSAWPSLTVLLILLAMGLLWRKREALRRDDAAQDNLEEGE